MIGQDVLGLLRFLRVALEDRRGATAVEYGLMVALISVVIIGAVATIGTELNTLFTDVGNCLTNISTCSSIGAGGGGGTTP
ncbi:MAG: Flp family type IVb pilin [Alphaproteobacteria bacterium]